MSHPGIDDIEASLLETSVDRYLRANYTFERRQAVIREREGFSGDAWAAFGEMGLLGAGLPDVLGGSSVLNIPTIMRAFGRALVVEPFVASTILSGSILAAAGTAAQRAEHLPGLISGETIWATGFAEIGSRFNLSNVSLAATPSAGGFLLNGAKSVVYAAGLADKIIVTARVSGAQTDSDGISLFVLEPRTRGVTIRSYATVDGMSAADIDFHDVFVPEGALIGPPGGGLPFIARAVDRATAAVCAEAAGAMEALNEKTLEHCKTRIVFGQPLAKFQVVQHRLVDMRVAQAHAQAMVDRAFLALNRDPLSAAAAVSAAKVQVAKEAALVAKEAVQLHGAMGLTDELDVSHYFRRITMICSLFGNADHHLRRFIAETPNPPVGGEAALEEVVDVDGLSPEELAFRDEVRAFYRRHLTPDLKQAASVTLWHMTAFEYGKRWQKILYENGYGAPNWPVEFGGLNWTPRQHLIWAAEQARARPPFIMLMGRNYAAPCIMKFGTDAQKDYFLPRIISGEDWWAQGYSEPGAGSDLAALQLSARSDGDDYVLNGSKIWATMAHHANRMFCLVRTTRGERKQAGITFLLLDMDLPGIDIRPIPNMAGDHDFNQVFFTDVRVPKSCRLGEEDGGWTVARHLLLYEHGVNLPRANMENIRRLGWLREIASLEADGHGGRLIDDIDFSRHIAEIAIGVQAMEFAGKQVFERISSGGAPGPADELLTIRSREVGQRLTELALDAIAYYGAPIQREARRAGDPEDPIGPAHAVLPMPFYLTQRGATIAGGAPEVHRNNLARHLLHI